MFLHFAPKKKKSERWREDGDRLQKGEPHIKADVLTPKPNINQLPGNREKDIKKRRRGAGGAEGFKAWLKFPETQELRVRVFACESRRRLLSAAELHELDLGSFAGATRPPLSFPTLVSVCLRLSSILGSAGESLPACRGRQRDLSDRQIKLSAHKVNAT